MRARDLPLIFLLAFGMLLIGWLFGLELAQPAYPPFDPAPSTWTPR